MIPSNSKQYKSALLESYSKLYTGDFIYILADENSVNFINYLLENIQYDNQYAFYIQNLRLSKFSEIILPKYNVTIYTHSIKTYLYYYNWIFTVIDMKEIYINNMLFFLASIYINLPSSRYDNNVFKNSFYKIYNKIPYQYYYYDERVEMSFSHYLYQKIILYEYNYEKDSSNIYSNLKSLTDPSVYYISDPYFLYDEPLCNYYTDIEYDILRIAFVYSFSGNEAEKDNSQFISSLYTLIWSNKNETTYINDTNMIYYEIFDLESNKNNCKKILDAIVVEGIFYVFGFSDICFEYIKNYKSIILFYSSMLIDFDQNTAPKNTIWIGGTIKQLFYSFPSYALKQYSYNYILLYNDKTYISKYIDEIILTLEVSGNIYVIKISSSDIFLQQYIEEILSRADYIDDKETLSLILFLSYDYLKKFINIYSKYSKEYENKILLYFICPEKQIIYEKPTFNCYIISFYLSSILNVFNNNLKVLLSSLNPDSYPYGLNINAINSIHYWLHIVKETGSYDINVLWNYINNHLNENILFSDGYASINDNYMLTKNVYIGFYNHKINDISIIYYEDKSINHFSYIYNNIESSNKYSIITICVDINLDTCNYYYEITREYINDYNRIYIIFR